jgi:uncharacterized membrane protein
MRISGNIHTVQHGILYRSGQLSTSRLSSTQLGDAARVAPIDKLSVVLVAVFGVVFLREHLNLVGWLGVLFTASGAVLIAVA